VIVLSRLTGGDDGFRADLPLERVDLDGRKAEAQIVGARERIAALRTVEQEVEGEVEAVIDANPEHFEAQAQAASEGRRLRRSPAHRRRRRPRRRPGARRRAPGARSGSPIAVADWTSRRKCQSVTSGTRSTSSRNRTRGRSPAARARRGLAFRHARAGRRLRGSAMKRRARGSRARRREPDQTTSAGSSARRRALSKPSTSSSPDGDSIRNRGPPRPHKATSPTLKNGRDAGVCWGSDSWCTVRTYPFAVDFNIWI
jgi:hypothetical protein